MKIIYFHQYFSTLSGSGGNRSYYFAKALIKAGHNVKIVCLNDARSNTGLKSEFKNGYRRGFTDGIEIIEFNIKYSNYDSIFKRSLKFLLFSLKSIKLAIFEDIDIVFATSTPLTVALPGILIRLIRNKPFVFEVRDLWPELPVAMKVLKNPYLIFALRILELITYKISNKCIALSPGIKKGIASKGKNHNDIYCIPNACDFETFGLSESNIKHPEKIKGLEIIFKKDDFIAAYTGAHGLANGLDAILDVASNLQKRGYDKIKFLFIGEGKYKKDLKYRVDKENLSNCFFLDLLPKYKLAAILKDSVHVGLMVLSNVPEFYNGTSPNKFFDYLSCGLPVINNYPGWLAEMIELNKLGLVVQPSKPELFANALIKIASNKNLLDMYGTNSYEFGAKNFSKEKASQQFIEIIEKTFYEFHSKKKISFQRRSYTIFKSLVDKSLALFLIISLTPLLLIIAIIIRLKLGSPIFFVQRRPGKNSKIFHLIKFRTMLNLNKENIPESERIIPFGSWLRKTSIDELPSLLNILKGDLSFVGPRPLLEQYLKYYDKEQVKRHDVIPGLSGWAQINGRNNISWNERFKLDNWYVNNQNLILDLRIILITIVKVLKRKDINPSNQLIMKPFKGNENNYF